MTSTTKLPSGLQIAREATLKPLEDIATGMGIGSHLLEPYGVGVTKIKLEAIEELKDRPRAKYVLISAITPAPLGEGKTTTTVGLGQAFKLKLHLTGDNHAVMAAHNIDIDEHGQVVGLS